MAKKEEKPKIVLERVYNVPLRREYQKVASWRRTEKAVSALRKFIAKHMKAERVLIGKYANELLWKHGIKNPPHHVKVNAVKDDKGMVSVELVDLPGKAKREMEVKKKLDKEAKKREAEKKQEQEKKKGESPEKIDEKDEAAKKEEKSKEIEKEEIKELKKEIPKQQHSKLPQLPKHVEQRPTAPKNL
jgi:large subunit ribosomal protein L31e